jgi:hypothetical protein
MRLRKRLLCGGEKQHGALSKKRTRAQKLMIENKTKKSITSTDNSSKRRKAASKSLAPSMTKGAWVQKRPQIITKVRCSSPTARPLADRRVPLL